MKISLTSFALRHFEKDFGGTKILNTTYRHFEKYVNEVYNDVDLFEERRPELPGYAPFCKLLPIKNFTDARVGSMPITLENYQYLRSGYSSRREGELPVFSRWFELPLGKPKAEWLMLVLYSKEQLEKEAQENPNTEPEIFDWDADYGIVAILGQSHPIEEPMKPETMIRNALGVKEGGSGVPLNKDAYLMSVKFWDKNATVK